MRGATRKYSQVHHLGFVVQNIDKAMTEIGLVYKIDKWYKPVNRSYEEMYYKGSKISIESEAVIGYCGKTEIEIISFTGGDENLYSIGLEENGPGFHHISFFIKDLETSVKELESLGYEKTQWGTMTGKSTVTRYVYFTKKNGTTNPILELNETRMGKRSIIRGRKDCFMGTLFGDMELVKKIKL